MYEFGYRNPVGGRFEVLGVRALDRLSKGKRETHKALTAASTSPSAAYEAFRKFQKWMLDPARTVFEAEGVKVTFFEFTTVAEWEAKHFPQTTAEQQ